MTHLRTTASRHGAPTLADFTERAFCPKDGRVDLLLMTAPSTVAERYGKHASSAGGDLPPLGICYIASYLRERGFGVGVLDATTLGLTYEAIGDLISAKNPTCIGFSATTFLLPVTVRLARHLRERFPDKLLILGGAHANAVPKHALLEFDCFDIVVFGDGELTTTALIEALRDKQWDRASFLADHEMLAGLQGVVFRHDGEVIQNAGRPVLADLDSLPFPARDLIPHEKYIPLPNHYKRTPVAHMVLIRGCPYVCTFCDQAYTKARTTSPARAVEEITQLVTDYGVRDIAFWDDTMTYNKKWMYDFCDRLIAAKLDLVWSCFAVVKTVDKAVLEKMREAGCWNIFYGIETNNPQLMKNIQADRKNKDADLVRQVMQWTKDVGIEVRGSFMIALPGETPEMAEETIRFALELDPDYAHFTITTPYPGTRLYDEIKQGKWGRLTTENFSEYQGWNVVFLPEGYTSKEQVWALEKKALRSFYFRPKFILRKLRALRSIEDLKRYLKGLRFLLQGFVLGPMPNRIREATGRQPQDVVPIGEAQN